LKKIVFITDFFLSDLPFGGGAEFNDEELTTQIEKSGVSVHKVRSRDLNIEFLKQLNEEVGIVLSNFTHLGEECKNYIEFNLNYIIYEHDHKYIIGRDPSKFVGFRAPNDSKINQNLYKNALAVFCQTDYHASILYRNLEIDNIYVTKCSFWSDDDFNVIQGLIDNDKEDVYSILSTSNANKNTQSTIKYCEKKNKNYELIADKDYYSFLKKLSKNNKFIFLPTTPETLSRVCVEARMLGCGVTTNSLVGCKYEKWFSLKGKELIAYLREQKAKVVQNLLNLFTGSGSDLKYVPLKKLSIVVPVYNDESHIKNALNDLLAQTYSNIEIIVVNDGSSDQTEKVCLEYQKKYNQIKYFSKKNGGTGSALNFGFKNATGFYGTWASSDDRRSPKCYDKLIKSISPDKELAFSAYYSERFRLNWRSYFPKDDEMFIDQQGFVSPEVKASGQVYIVKNWIELNYNNCHSGVCFLFTMSLKRRCGEYLELPGEDYHMAVKMAMNTKENEVVYIDEVLGVHGYNPTSLTSENVRCVLEAEAFTKQMIVDWKNNK